MSLVGFDHISLTVFFFGKDLEILQREPLAFFDNKFLGGFRDGSGGGFLHPGVFC